MPARAAQGAAAHPTAPVTDHHVLHLAFDASYALHVPTSLTLQVTITQLLTLSRSGNTLTLTWGPGWTLQSSINVTGLYQDVPEAASPYPVSMDNPSQFFRLRQ